jgi:hypothetical protein
MTTLAELLPTETKEAIYARGLAVATTLGLPVTSWAAGDPTRADFHFISEIMSLLEGYVANYVAAGFLDLCAADSAKYQWLVRLAEQVYGYTATEANYATCTLRLTNGSGAEYVIEAGDITCKVPGTEVTYHNTSGGTLVSGVGNTLDLDIVCDVAGSDGTAGIGDITELVTNLLDVTISNTTAAVGVDEESASSIVANCRAKLGSLSPNGPADAYDYAARVLSGAANVTRTRVLDDSTTGDVTVYCASSTGAASVADVALAEDAIYASATPLCITPNVLAATNKTQAVTYTIWLYDSVGKTGAEVEAAIELALADLFAARPIGGDIIAPATTGKLRRSLIIAAIRAVYPDHVIDVQVATPAADVSLTIAEVPVLGTVTCTGGPTFEVTP